MGPGEFRYLGPALTGSGSDKSNLGTAQSSDESTIVLLARLHLPGYALTAIALDRKFISWSIPISEFILM